MYSIVSLTKVDKQFFLRVSIKNEPTAFPNGGLEEEQCIRRWVLIDFDSHLEAVICIVSSCKLETIEYGCVCGFEMVVSLAITSSYMYTKKPQFSQYGILSICNE